MLIEKVHVVSKEVGVMTKIYGLPIVTYRDSRVDAVTLPTGAVELRGEQDLPVGGIKHAELQDFLDWHPDAGHWSTERFREELFSHVWAERVDFSTAEVEAWSDHNDRDRQATNVVIPMMRWIRDQRRMSALRESVRTNPRAILDAATQRRGQAKHFRLTKSEMELLDQGVLGVLEKSRPQSVRHVYYVLVGRIPELVPKTEPGYETVDRACIRLRKNGRLPYSWISDATRVGHHVATYENAGDLISQHAAYYRHDLWKRANAHVEVWCESRSIAAVLLPLCRELCVSLYPTSGFSSLTQTWEAAQVMQAAANGRPIRVVYVGDYDPAGKHIDRDAIEKLRKHLTPYAQRHGMKIEHCLREVRVAVNEDQIVKYNLPTKPRKKGDLRCPEITRTVEAEALPAEVLLRLVREEIEAYLPLGELDLIRVAEESEREHLRTIGELTSRHGATRVAGLCLDTLGKRE